ncbi:hypothetical protein FBY03_103168 [Pseudomonas sp. SJZ079]|nr:hypothetical protein FBY03_103168 [Pseudomonas sp. SJZ079]
MYPSGKEQCDGSVGECHVRPQMMAQQFNLPVYRLAACTNRPAQAGGAVRARRAVHEQINVKIGRTALLAELPQKLRPYSCRLAYQLMGDFMSTLQEVTRNPLA